MTRSNEAMVQLKNLIPSYGRGTQAHERVGAAGATFAASVLFDGISRRFGAVDALRDISFKVAPGETVCLLGESGCGKTTLLRIAAGIEVPTSGAMEMNGKVMSSPTVQVPPENRNIGLVFQDYALFPHLTILQNVMFGLTALTRQDAKTVAEQSLSRVRMVQYADAYPHMLSGGQQQRVALARAVAPRPQLLLLDEPFSGLDSVLRDQIREETLAVLRETGATSIIVTHDPEEALYLGDRVALMKNGRIEQVGSPQQLYQSPRNGFVAGFFGGLNRFSAVVKNGSVLTPLGAFPAPGYPGGTDVEVMIRIEGVDVRDADPSQSYAGGRVLSQKFAGNSSWITVLVVGEDGPQKLKLRAKKPLKSNLVSFLVDPASVLIFTRSGN